MNENNYYKVIYDDGDNEVIYFLDEDRVLFITGDFGIDYYLNSQNAGEELYNCFDHIMNKIPNKQEADCICEIISSLLNKWYDEYMELDDYKDIKHNLIKTNKNI